MCEPGKSKTVKLARDGAIKLPPLAGIQADAAILATRQQKFAVEREVARVDAAGVLLQDAAAGHGGDLCRREREVAHEARGWR